MREKTDLEDSISGYLDIGGLNVPFPLVTYPLK